jgi:hypothetical protein
MLFTLVEQAHDVLLSWLRCAVLVHVCRCDWLNNKNTIFGKVVGDTIYNTLRLNDLEVGPADTTAAPHHSLLLLPCLAQPCVSQTRRQPMAEPGACLAWLTFLLHALHNRLAHPYI